MTSGPAVRYARTDDGLDIAYTVAGSGERDVVVIHGFTTHLDLIWDCSWHTTWDRLLREHFRVITFDKRGTGLSDRALGFGSIEERTRDLLAVMDAAGSEHASLVGISEGAPMSVVMAASHRERVDRVVIYGGFARVTYASDFPDGVPEELQQQFLQMLLDTWGTGDVFGRFFIDSSDDARETMARLERNACTPQMAGKIMEANYRIDVRALLPSVVAPTLVIHNAGDPLIRPAVARMIADAIPNAQYLELEGNYHCTGYVERALPRVEAAVRFLVGDDPAPAGAISSSRVLASVLFTDIADSTDLAARTGDRAWTDLLTRHDAIASTHVSGLGGRLVKQTGDGTLAIFDGPSRGIECARRIRESLRPLGLELRAGVHTGEIEQRGDDVSGIGVHICARVMGAAKPGETWVTRTVRDLTFGSSFEFDDRGAHELKGVPDEWHLFAVPDAADSRSSR